MSAPFKVGDKVRCIKASSCGFPGEVGKIYVVKTPKDSLGGLCLEREGRGRLDERRFELVQEEDKMIVASGTAAGCAEGNRAQQVARDKNGKEIRVGDRVRVLQDRVCGFMRGQEGVVIDFPGYRGSYGPYFTFKADDGREEPCSPVPEQFEVISTAKEESELERLVRKANEGLEALKTLKQEHVGGVEFTSLGTYDRGQYVLLETSHFDYLTGADWAVKFRVKPRPTFTPFTVGNGWKVELKGDRLHIGCREYAAKFLKKAFKALLSGAVNEDTLYAFRHGIRDSNESITWYEAERILKALEDYGV